MTVIPIPEGAIEGLSTEKEAAFLWDPVTKIITVNGSLAPASPGLAFASYTPALTVVSGTNPTLGTGGVQQGRYMQIGKLVVGQANIRFGTSGAAAGSGTYRVSLPVAMAANINIPVIGSGWIVDNNLAAVWTVSLDFSTSTTAFLRPTGATPGVVTNAHPFTWANEDLITFHFSYEAA